MLIFVGQNAKVLANCLVMGEQVQKFVKPMAIDTN